MVHSRVGYCYKSFTTDYLLFLLLSANSPYQKRFFISYQDIRKKYCVCLRTCVDLTEDIRFSDACFEAVSIGDINKTKLLSQNSFYIVWGRKMKLIASVTLTCCLFKMFWIALSVTGVRSPVTYLMKHIKTIKTQYF